MSGWRKEEFCLPAISPGTERRVVSYHFGPDDSDHKVYIQAGLHADEAPGYLVARQLVQDLIAAAERGDVRSEIIVVPVANPVGLAQWGVDVVSGRFDRSDLVNFNRSYPELTGPVAEKLQGQLTNDGSRNVALIRSCIRQVLREMMPVTETDHLKHYLLSLSSDADIVLDLHCDHQALIHLYLGTPLWPRGEILARQMGAGVSLLAENSGGEPFDEANSKLWWELAERFPDFPVPPSCMAVTVELRGVTDTDPDQTKEDSANLYRYLQRCGCIAGEPGELASQSAFVTPLAGVDYVKAPVAGIVSFVKKQGDMVHSGEVIGTIINPLQADSAGSVNFCSATDGLLFARSADRIARPGKILAKVAGERPLVEKGAKLLTA